MHFETIRKSGMEDLIDFITTANAPWWSALVGIAAGGFLTYFTTLRSMKAQADLDKQRSEIERKHAEHDHWRDAAVSHVSEFIAVHFRYLEYVIRARRDINTKHALEDRNESNHAYIKDVADDLSEKGLPLMSEMQRIYSLIEITTGGGVAQAARNLILKDNEHVPQLSEREFERTREDASVASAILMHTAKRRLSIKQDADDPVVANLIKTARSVKLPDVR